MQFITVAKDSETTRCVGFFENYTDAVNRVIHNSFDISEDGYYPYAILEYIPEGIYQYSDDRIGYVFSKELGEYVRLSLKDLPQWISKGVGFAIG